MDRRHFIAGVALWAAIPRLAAAQAGWVLLGSRTVNWAAGRDSIFVSRRLTTPPSQLRFRARGGEIFITNVQISFLNGGRQNFWMNSRLRSGMTSHSIRLRSRRDVRRIDFDYHPVRPSRGGLVTVEAFGRR